MKLIFGIIAVFIIGAIGFITWSPKTAPTNDPIESPTVKTEDNKENTIAQQSVVTEGKYIVQAEKSKVNWAGKKPLIEGYINRGSIGVKAGTVSVEPDTVSADFTIDMKTLSVSDTPTKPGKETTLAEHLQGERWFDVAKFPEATFSISKVTPRADSKTTFIYDVEGDLTMKGVAGKLQFPATIFEDADGLLKASADFEFDRTKWGITSGSGSFFDNLANNVIDDMVALSFTLVAEKQ